VARSATIIGIGLALLAMFVVAGAFAIDADPAAWEIETTRWVHRRDDAWAVLLWPIMALGSTPGGIAVTGLVWWQLGRRPGLVVGISFAAAYVTASVAKRVVERARPDAIDLGEMPRQVLDTFAFPSGHSAQSFAIAVAVALVATRWGPWRFALVPLAAITSLARMYFGVHFLGDVLAGAVLGTGIALVVDQLVPRDTASGPPDPSG